MELLKLEIKTPPDQPWPVLNQRAAHRISEQNVYSMIVLLSHCIISTDIITYYNVRITKQRQKETKKGGKNKQDRAS